MQPSTGEHKRLRRSRWALVLGVGLVALSVLTFTAFADWTKTSNVTHHETTGSIVFTLADPGNGQYITLTADNIVPGDTIDRVIDATDGGNAHGSAVGLTTSATVGAADPLYTNDANGLQVRIDKCSVAWTVNGDNSITCGG